MVNFLVALWGNHWRQRSSLRPRTVVYTQISSFTQFFIHKNCFELFLSAHFLFWEILSLNLTFAVCRVREASTLIISSSNDSRRPSILQVTSTLTLALYWDLLGLRQAFLPLKSHAKERLRRKLRARRFTNLIWLFSVNLGSAFIFFQDGLLSQGNQDLILKIFSKIPKMSPDGKRLQVISSTHLINSS